MNRGPSKGWDMSAVVLFEKPLYSLKSNFILPNSNWRDLIREGLIFASTRNGVAYLRSKSL